MEEHHERSGLEEQGIGLHSLLSIVWVELPFTEHLYLAEPE